LAIEYEGLPDFCKHCNNIGHDVSKCRWLYPRKDESISKVTGEKGRSNKGKEQISTTKPVWKPSKGNPSRTGSSRAFEAPPAVTNTVPVTPRFPKQHNIINKNQSSTNTGMSHNFSKFI